MLCLEQRSTLSRSKPQVPVYKTGSSLAREPGTPMRVGNSVVLPIPLSLPRESERFAPESFLGVESYAGRRHQKLRFQAALRWLVGMGGGADGWSSVRWRDLVLPLDGKAVECNLRPLAPDTDQCCEWASF